MKKLTVNETASFLRGNDGYTILTHTRPDGDTVGSGAALCRGLRSIGKTAHVLLNPEVSDLFSPLNEGLIKSVPESGDILIAVDVAAPNMLPKEFEALAGAVDLRIDHHGTAVSFSRLELVDSASASCAEIIYDLLKELNCGITEEIMRPVYVGASTDTGCFRFANTTAHSFEVAAECVRAGVPVYELNQKLFETNTISRLRMQAWMVEHIRMLHNGEAAVCAIPLSVEKELGVTRDDMDNIANVPRTIAGVRIAATLRETEDGGIKLSVRAVPGCDASKVAAHFGGGGHVGAAGASFRMQMAEAAEETAGEILTALKSEERA